MVRLQDRGHSALRDGEWKPLFRLQPDAVIETSSGATGPPIVLDTKWKELTSGKPRCERTLGVEQSDIYQMLAYARAYGAGRLILLYPWHKALGKRGDSSDLDRCRTRRLVRWSHGFEEGGCTETRGRHLLPGRCRGRRPPPRRGRRRLAGHRRSGHRIVTFGRGQSKAAGAAAGPSARTRTRLETAVRASIFRSSGCEGPVRQEARGTALPPRVPERSRAAADARYGRSPPFVRHRSR